jgi:hypothetical protein
MEFDLAADRAGFIGRKVLRVMNVALQAGPFGRIKLKDLLQSRDTKRAPGSGYSRGKWKFTTDSYACDEHGVEEPVDDREARMYASYFDAEAVASMRAFDGVLREQEKRIADLIFNAETWTGASLTTAVPDEWDDPENASPVDDVDAACEKVWAASGQWPNALIINRHVFRNLRKTEQIIDRITSLGAGSPAKAADVTPAMIGQCFDLPLVFVAGGATNSANEGQDASIGKIWSDEYAMVCRVAMTDNDIREPCIGRMFHWDADGSQIEGAVETYRDETVRSDIVRVRNDVDEKLLYVEMGHLLSNITTK